MSESSDALPLGEFLNTVRRSRGMTLREVEAATDRRVSNAYLSQLENEKIGKPSPNILHALSEVYAVPYERLMQKAGYLAASESGGSAEEKAGKRHGRVATFAKEALTDEEEEKLLEYLAFLRTKRK